MSINEQWASIMREIPSEAFAPTMRTTAFGARARLADFASNSEKLNYLEVGCRLGHSLAAVMLACPSARATVIDSWVPNYAGEPNPGPEPVRAHLQSLGVDLHHVNFISGDSHEILPTLPKKRTFDLIFIDGDHEPDGAEADLRAALPLLRRDGLLVFDDAKQPLYDVCERVVTEFGLRATYQSGEPPFFEVWAP